MTHAPLRIRLFGELDLRLGGEPGEQTFLPPLESARAGSLLAYLLVHRDAPQPRRHLAFLLWPDSSEAQARTNLRHVLHTLRHSLPDPERFLVVTPRMLQWRPDAPFWLDVAAFEEALVRAEERAGDDAIAALREAVALYAGDLLEGCYDDWLVPERERLRERHLTALDRLTTLLEARRDDAAAIHVAERLLRHDPLHEESYRRLLRLHDARGNRARALRVYHDCAATLERELGVEPSPATREAYEALLPGAREEAGAGPADGRLGGPPLVGRAPEWTCLTTLWREAERGRAQFVVVSGESGIGKTRLIEELRAWCAQRGAAIAQARSYPAEGALPYGALAAWLRGDALWGGNVRLSQAHRAELARLLPECAPEQPLLAVPEPLSAHEQRLRLFAAATAALLAAGRPLLLIADDLHWCDRETMQFLHYLVRTAPEARLLVAATARREETDDEHPLTHLLAGLHVLERVTEIPLGRLTREETALLAEQVAGHPMASSEVDRLYGETEGSPLFVVEVLRAGWTSGPRAQPWLTAKVQAVIESRLARLSKPARELVDVAATIGREFTPDALAAASDLRQDAFVPALDELWRRRIIREQDAHAYDFSHDKIREVAYLALSPALRRRHHAAVAGELARLHAADPEAVAGQIAAHRERAGQRDEAIAWYQRAADVAQQRYASGDAARLLGRALDLLRTLPATTERDYRELALLAALPATLWAEGFASPRLADVHRRALALAGALGVEPPPPLLRSLAITSLTQGDFAGAQRFARQLRERGGRDEDGVLFVESEYVLGIAAFWQGQFAAARRHFETAVDCYRPDQRRAHLLQYGLDPKVICLSRLGNTLWFLGHIEAATGARDAALALAEEIGHPYSQATALVFAAYLAIELRDLEGLRGYATALAAERDSEAPQARIPAAVFAAYLDVVAGQWDGLAPIQRALAETRGAEPAPGFRACMTRVLLEACAAAGESRIGLRVAEDALAAGGATLWEAETRRQRALFLAALGAPWSEIEAELVRALEIARGQEARSLAARVAVSLLQLSLRHGDEPAVSAARDTLRDVLRALPERQETAELREARSLLA
jgi:DNA-binding SARP family transcriptional activator